MAKQYVKRKNKAKEIARERIAELFTQAGLRFKKNKSLAKRYVTLARKIATKHKVKIPDPLKRKFCKLCGSYLLVGTNARIRLRNGKKNYFCMECNSLTRVPYK